MRTCNIYNLETDPKKDMSYINCIVVWYTDQPNVGPNASNEMRFTYLDKHLQTHFYNVELSFDAPGIYFYLSKSTCLS